MDDSATIRETLGLLIDAQPDMELVGSAASGQEAVRRAAELQPDIVLMDIHMPDLDGIQATWLVSSRAPHGAVIMVTSEERIDFLQKAMSAGAQGYVLKPFGNGAQLFQTIRDVHGRSSARRMQVVGGAAQRLCRCAHESASASSCWVPKAGSGRPPSPSAWRWHCAPSARPRSRCSTPIS